MLCEINGDFISQQRSKHARNNACNNKIYIHAKWTPPSEPILHTHTYTQCVIHLRHTTRHQHSWKRNKKSTKHKDYNVNDYSKLGCEVSSEMLLTARCALRYCVF